MNPISNPFEELLVSLAKQGIAFIVVGGIACALNGYVRTTEDVDILIQRDKKNIKNLLAFLSHYGQGYGAELGEADFNDEEGAIRVIENFPIDIFTVMSGKYYEDFEKMSKTVNLNDTDIRYLDRNALIFLKSGSLREKDKMDAVQLKLLKQESSI